MYIAVVIAFALIIITLLLHKRQEVPQTPYIVEAYDVFKKTSIGKKNDHLPTSDDANTSAIPPQQMAALRKTCVRPARRKVADTRMDIRRKKFLRYCEEQKEKTTAQENEASPQEEKAESIVIPIVQDKSNFTSASAKKTGEIPAQIPRNSELADAVNSLPRDTDRFDSQFYKKNLEAQNRPNYSEMQATAGDGQADMSLPPTAKIEAASESSLMGETACQINEMESLCQEIDRIIQFMQQKPDDITSHAVPMLSKELMPNFQKNFKEKVNQAFASGNAQCLQDFDKILEELHLPLPQDLLKHNNSPAGELAHPRNELDVISDHLKIPPDHSDSIEIWKKMLGFK